MITMRNCITATKAYNIENYHIVIPAAGMGRRVKSYGPKSLMLIDNEYLFIKQLKVIRKIFPNNNITYILGFYAEQIKEEIRKFDDTIQFIYNKDYEITNVAYSLGLGLDSLSTKVTPFIIYGDLLFNTNSLLSLVGHRDENILLIDKYNNMNIDEVGLIYDNNNVLNLSYGLEDKWAQMFILSKDSIRPFERLCMKNKKYFCYQIINELISQNIPFKYVDSKDNKIIEIDMIKDLTLAQGVKWLNP